jgi:hypothetical protein
MSYSLAEWADVATILGAVAIPIAALALALPLRQQASFAKAANAHALTELAASLNMQLIQDPDVARLWVEGAEKFETYSRIERFRYTELLVWWLLLHETAFVHKKSKLLDDGTYAAWQSDLRQFAAEHRLHEHWSSLRANLHPDFVRHLESLLPRLRA